MRVLYFLTLCLSFALLANAGTERTNTPFRALAKNTEEYEAWLAEQERLEAEKLEAEQEKEEAEEEFQIGETIAAALCYLCCWVVIGVCCFRRRIFGDDCTCCDGDCKISNLPGPRYRRDETPAMRERAKEAWRKKYPNARGKICWNRICCEKCCDKSSYSDDEEAVADNKVAPN